MWVDLCLFDTCFVFHRVVETTCLFVFIIINKCGIHKTNEILIVVETSGFVHFTSL